MIIAKEQQIHLKFVVRKRSLSQIRQVLDEPNLRQVLVADLHRLHLHEPLWHTILRNMT